MRQGEETTELVSLFEITGPFSQTRASLFHPVPEKCGSVPPTRDSELVFRARIRGGDYTMDTYKGRFSSHCLCVFLHSLCVKQLMFRIELCPAEYLFRPNF